MSLFNFSIIAAVDAYECKNVPCDSFNEFAQFMTEQAEKREFPGKGGPLWLPCSFTWDAQTSTFHPVNALAKPTCLFGMDFDDDGNTWTNVQAALDELDCDYFIHTTMSYVPGSKDKARAVIPLTTPINDNDQNKLLFDAVQNMWSGKLKLDAACSNIARKFYIPATNTQTGHKCVHRHVNNRGAYDPTGIIAQASRQRAKAILAARMKQSANAKRAHGKIVKSHGSPYWNGLTDQNLFSPLGKCRKLADEISTQASKGAYAAKFACTLVKATNGRFPNGVDDQILEKALADVLHGSTHNNFAQLIRDARRVVR
ncbi:hypothetical protein HK28_10555 [Acetobacter sp. DsW_063]|nr:hypothetical protein HK28_10555 [Acetobacter sp. DsW_063]